MNGQKKENAIMENTLNKKTTGRQQPVANIPTAGKKAADSVRGVEETLLLSLGWGENLAAMVIDPAAQIVKLRFCCRFFQNAARICFVPSHTALNLFRAGHAKTGLSFFVRQQFNRQVIAALKAVKGFLRLDDLRGGITWAPYWLSSRDMRGLAGALTRTGHAVLARTTTQILLAANRANDFMQCGALIAIHCAPPQLPIRPRPFDCLQPEEKSRTFMILSCAGSVDRIGDLMPSPAQNRQPAAPRSGRVDSSFRRWQSLRGCQKAPRRSQQCGGGPRGLAPTGGVEWR